ncbi:MAG: hypothetical protein ACO1OF_16465 [Adhaeribacter sp.]
MILLKDALAQMEKKDERNWPVPFTIEFVTADRERNTGGEVIRLEKVVLARDVKGLKKKTSAILDSTEPDRAANPNHWLNGTRNLYHTQSQQIRKCHIRLITKFNGQPVIY